LGKRASLLLIVALSLALAAGLVIATGVWPATGAAALLAGREVKSWRLASPIAVDGDLSDWPAAADLYLDATSAQYTAGNISSPLDLSASLRSAWDDNYLYFAVVITDNMLIADSTNVWDDDSIEIALDGALDGRCCGNDDHQYIIAIDGRLADLGTLIPANTLPMSLTVRQVASGYRVEMAIPLLNLTGAPVMSGTVMGINLALNDDDDGGRRDKRLVWIGNSTLDFTNLGNLIFTGESAAVPTRAATTTPSATPIGPITTPTASPAPTLTTVPTVSRTSTPTVTPTPTGQPTASADQRLAQLEGNIVSLQAKIAAIVDILRQAGRFPEGSAPSATATPPPATPAPDARAYYQAVNCGGPAYTALNGDFYSADQAYAPGGWGYVGGGQTSQVANAISGTTDAVLYQSERYNFTGYSFDVPNGTYNVVLRFAEIYQYAVKGSRIFDVKLEDQVVIKDLDIMARVGTFAALDFTFPVTVTDGQLNLTLIASKGAAKINAIMVKGVVPSGPTPTPSAGSRVDNIAARLTDLETTVAAILDVFRSTHDTPTPTVTATPTRTATPLPGTSTPTRTATAPAAPVSTSTVTPTPGGPTATPHISPKKGVGGWDNPTGLAQVGLSWGYNWSLSPNNYNSIYEHVPMIFGKDYDAQSVAAIARAHPGSNWLIWNEPDYWQQANIKPTEAAQLYRTLRPLIKGADPTARLIVGGVYNLDTQWLSDFRSEYYRLYNEWPVVEGWAVHYYVGSTTYDKTAWRQALERVRDWMQANGGMVELWLTEFGCLNSDSIAYQVMADQVPWLDAQPWLTRYAWFAAFASGQYCPNCSGSLFNSDGSLTSLGQLYRSLP